MESQNELFRGLDERIKRDLDEGDVAYFNAAMLKLEYLTKIVVVGVVACIDDDADLHRYSLEHKLVRANSLGDWIEVLNTALVGPPAQFLIPEARHIIRDLTERVGYPAWRFDAVNSLGEAAKYLGARVELGDRVALRRFFEIAAQIRNRTRGHGATVTTQCHAACPLLIEAIDRVVENMALLQLSWVHLHQNLSGKYRVSPLLNNPSPFDYLSRNRSARIPSGVYVHLGAQSNSTIARHLPLVYTDVELSDIALPNGNFEKGKFESLSYVTNEITLQNGEKWSGPGTRLPSSETEGAPALAAMEGFFANLPPMPSGYVPRLSLENRLTNELKTTERHPIITLTGPGGIGKTTIALQAIYSISMEQGNPYEVVLWISARDIDLLDQGPKTVSRSVFSQRDISQAAVGLLDPAEREEKEFNPEHYFQQCLTSGAAGTTLFVLDNFETLQNPVDVYEWLDTHIRLPNKVLITTRFRDFLGDYPIQIGGMLEEEANTLIDQHANRLGISNLIGASYRTELISESEGHPYVIKILLGQVAKERRAVKTRRIVATASHLLDALFKRTYEALSSAAQRVFLLLCSWRVYVPEIAVQAVSLRPGTERFDVAAALDEAIQYSLIDQTTSEEDDSRFVGVPLAAAIFGQRELEVSRFKIGVEEDRKLLMLFGAGRRDSVHKGPVPRINNLIDSVASRIDDNPSELDEFQPILEYLASCYPATYLNLADLVLRSSRDESSLRNAERYLKAFIESADPPEKKLAWERLVLLYSKSNDTVGEIHALCELALLPTSDHLDLGKIANQLNGRIRELKDRRIADAWSHEVRELLQEVIRSMEHKLDKLSATHCSRLAWLHLNVENRERALDVAKIGLARDPENEHCQKLIRGLED